MTKKHLAWKLVSLLLLPSLILGANGISITSISIPPAIENGTSSVILDCDYAINCEETSGLVVHWYWRHLPEPVYQWIPNKPPQGLGFFRGKINLDYVASDDPCKKHRAMQIVNPTTDISGEFRCKVSTWYAEDSMSGTMVVYVREDSLTVSHSKTASSNEVNVSCHVEGVHPEPKLELTQERGSYGDRRPILDAVLATTLREDGRYDVTLFKVFDERHLRGETSFECTLSLPGTEYQTSRKITYFPPMTTTSTPSIDDNSLDNWDLISSSSTSESPLRSTTDLNDLSVEDTSVEQWQSIGRGIRAHDSNEIIDSGSSIASLSLGAVFCLVLAIFW